MCGKGLCMMSPGVTHDLMEAERQREREVCSQKNIDFGFAR